MFQTKVVEKIKKKTLYIIYIFFENRAIYEIMWKNIAEADRPQVTIIRRTRFACWLTKATDTHSEYVVLIAFQLQHL